MKGKKTTRYVQGADVVLLCSDAPAGEAPEDSAFIANAAVAREVALTAADLGAHAAPAPVLLVCSDPVNSLVPLMAEVLELAGALDCGRVLGVAAQDALCAAGVLSGLSGLGRHRLHVPVVGGRSARTAVPVLSQARPFRNFTSTDWREVRAALVEREKVSGRSGAQLARGYAAARTALAVVRALRGEPGVNETVFVRSDEMPGVR
ncbi:putative malate dehydrogenase, mitochondrial [Frankliniella fusca]|uniref:Malate dehydrogenase, mitochondrial n=1 Tax=Frankliniella fusca TaxID=407009 RepID=A0AAE1H9P1_9NEOP|nr:putative malate dehydrogenase, mitochondrial [Frankliniella fusca]